MTFSKVRRASAAHIAKAIDDRRIMESDLQRLEEWKKTKPLVPNWYWYKDFGTFFVVGDGPSISSVLSDIMTPEGIKLA